MTTNNDHAENTGHCSLDGRMIRVRSCTERSGVWVERFFPKDSGARVNMDDNEPDDYLFIPHDVRAAVAQEIASIELDVDPGDDEYAYEGDT